jgi:hypothetical protein
MIIRGDSKVFYVADAPARDLAIPWRIIINKKSIDVSGDD